MSGPINETTRQVWKTGVGEGVIKGELEGMVSAGSQADQRLALC